MTKTRAVAPASHPDSSDVNMALECAIAEVLLDSATLKKSGSRSRVSFDKPAGEEAAAKVVAAAKSDDKAVGPAEAERIQSVMAIVSFDDKAQALLQSYLKAPTPERGTLSSASGSPRARKSELEHARENVAAVMAHPRDPNKRASIRDPQLLALRAQQLAKHPESELQKCPDLETRIQALHINGSLIELLPADERTEPCSVLAAMATYSKAIRHLDPARPADILAALAVNGAGIEHLRGDMQIDPRFITAALPTYPAFTARVSLKNVAVLARDRDNLLSLMEHHRVFHGLTASDKQRLGQLLGGRRNKFSQYWRNALGELIGSKEFISSMAPERVARLHEFITQPPVPNFASELLAGTFPGPREHTIHRVEDTSSAPFVSGSGPAQRHVVEIGSYKIDVYITTKRQPSLHYSEIEQVAAMLASLSTDQLSAIKNVCVEPEKNCILNQSWLPFPADMKATMPDQVSLFPGEQSRAVPRGHATLIHEVGHLASVACWGEVKQPQPYIVGLAEVYPKGWNEWKDACRKDGLALSRYAKTDVQDDLSEHWEILEYALLNPELEEELKLIIPNRYLVLQKLRAQWRERVRLNTEETRPNRE